VVPPIRDPCVAQRLLDDGHGVGRRRALLTIRAGEDEGARASGPHRVQQVRTERIGHGNRVHVPTLRRAAVVRSADPDRACLEVEGVLGERQEFALAHERVEGGHHQIALPGLADSADDAPHLVFREGRISRAGSIERACASAAGFLFHTLVLIARLKMVRSVRRTCSTLAVAAPAASISRRRPSITWAVTDLSGTPPIGQAKMLDLSRLN
jgi:hypothetical protein